MEHDSSGPKSLYVHVDGTPPNPPVTTTVVASAGVYYNPNWQWIPYQPAQPGSLPYVPYNPYPTQPVVPQPLRTWVCPKCGRVYSELQLGCSPCNSATPSQPVTVADIDDVPTVVWDKKTFPESTVSAGTYTVMIPLVSSYGVRITHDQKTGKYYDQNGRQIQLTPTYVDGK